MTEDSLDDPAAIVCDRCAGTLRPGAGNFYVIRIVAVADPAPPLIPEEGLLDEIGDEIRRLIAQAGGMSEQQLTDQVYRTKLLHLCATCYPGWMDDPVGAGR